MIKKRVESVVIGLIVILFFVSGCSATGDAVDKTPVDGGDVENNKSTVVNVSERVILDQDDIIITLKSLENDSFFGPSLKILVENNSEKAVTVQTRNSSVNGIMIETMFSVDVEPGKKSNDEISFMSYELERAGISTIKTIEFKFNVFDAESWDDVLYSDVIIINTSADESYVQKYDDSGKTVLDEKDFKIVMKRVETDDSFWGADIYIYIENNSGTDVTIQARDVSINGFMIDPMFSSDVLAGKKAFDTITFFESDLEENEIDSIDEMELSFHVFTLEDWNDMFDSATILVTFEN